MAITDILNNKVQIAGFGIEITYFCCGNGPSTASCSHSASHTGCQDDGGYRTCINGNAGIPCRQHPWASHIQPRVHIRLSTPPPYPHVFPPLSTPSRAIIWGEVGCRN